MFRSSKTTEDSESPLDSTARQYAHVGWHITSRTVNAITMEKESAKDPQPVKLSVDADGKITVDGPPLPVFAVDGRMRSWLMLLLITFTVFAVAWALGFFR
jgi:hypothetical protein